MDKEIIRESRVLIVDDNPANAALMEKILRQAGYLHFMSINDSREVVNQLRTFRPDLIVLDLMMPHVDGFGVMTQLRGYIPDETYLPILVITADVSKPARERALAVGAKDFLTKPVDTTEAALRIYNLLETRWLYRQIQDKNRVLMQQVRSGIERLAAANAELDRLADAAVPAALLVAVRKCVAKAVESIDQIGKTASGSDRSAELATAD